MTFGGRFLHEPGLFPARGSGERWGEDDLTVDAAGGPYTFSGLSKAQVESSLERLQGFLSPEQVGREEGVLCGVFRADEAEFRTFDLRGWEMTLDMERSEGAVKIAGLRFMARIEWRPTLRAALWTPSTDGAFAGILENVLRILVSYRLLETGGLLAHSVGLIRGDGVWLCLGRSGAGKSTLATLALGQGGRVLSDDLNAVTRTPRGLAVEGVPFAGDHRASGRERHPLAGIAVLEKGSPGVLAPLGRATALSALVACAPFVNHDVHWLDLLLASSESVLATPLTRLTFALDSDLRDLFKEPAVV